MEAKVDAPEPIVTITLTRSEWEAIQFGLWDAGESCKFDNDDVAKKIWNTVNDAFTRADSTFS